MTAPLDTGAVLVRRAVHSLGLFHGAGAPAVINGLVTNEVGALAPGQSCYAAALTPKGKLLADLRVLRREGEVLVDVAPAAAPGWWSMVRKYVNPRLAKFEDVSDAHALFDLAGPAAAGVAVAALPGAPGTLASGAHVTATIAGAPCTVLRQPLGDVDRWTLYVPSAVAGDVARACEVAGAVASDPSVLESARIEAGMPTWGLDMDDNTLVQEARLDERDGVSYTKGCYTGQETVARLHFRGHVNKLLRGLRATPGARLPRGASLVREDGSVVGDIRSSAQSPRLGTIALGMVRREVEPGTPLRARWDEGEEAVELVDLPFPR